MLVATVRIKLNKLGQDAVRDGVTPAEAVFFVAEHSALAGGPNIEVIGETEEVERTASQEIGRLYGRYPAKKIKTLYPTVMSPIPATFEEAISIGMGVELPSGKLMEMSLSK